MTTNNVSPIRKPADRGPELGPVVAELRLEYLTDAELASLDRQSPGLREAIQQNEFAEYRGTYEPEPIAYDNGIEPVGLSGVGR